MFFLNVFYEEKHIYIVSENAYLALSCFRKSNKQLRYTTVQSSWASDGVSNGLGQLPKSILAPWAIFWPEGLSNFVFGHWLLSLKTRTILYNVCLMGTFALLPAVLWLQGQTTLLVIGADHLSATSKKELLVPQTSWKLSDFPSNCNQFPQFEESYRAQWYQSSIPHCYKAYKTTRTTSKHTFLCCLSLFFMLTFSFILLYSAWRSLPFCHHSWLKICKLLLLLQVSSKYLLLLNNDEWWRTFIELFLQEKYW